MTALEAFEKTQRNLEAKKIHDLSILIQENESLINKAVEEGHFAITREFGEDRDCYPDMKQHFLDDGFIVEEDYHKYKISWRNPKTKEAFENALSAIRRKLK